MSLPDWFHELTGLAALQEGEAGMIGDRRVVLHKGVLRSEEVISAAQAQTKDTFGFKWAKRDTFEGATREVLGAWLREKYGDVSNADWFLDYGPNPLLLDAGCGAGLSAGELFAEVLKDIRYVGVDISTAADDARDRFEKFGADAAFIQSDLNTIPLPNGVFDLVFSEGVLHHTDDTFAALSSVTEYLRPGGRILFYVYRKKGPVREFTDDYVRDKMQKLSPEAGWEAMEALTKLGVAFGELDAEIKIPEDIDLLEIPAGKMSVQRFFYWHVCKTFYRPEMNLQEMNHLNFDWFAPKNAHRHTVEEVRGWCEALGLSIEMEREELAGITIIAQRTV